MMISLTHPNPALISIIENPEQVITLDANFLIPPDRSQISNIRIPFNHFKNIWLEPIFNAFRNIAIHEAVYDELVDYSPQKYIDEKRDKFPPEIIIHKDSSFSEAEEGLRNSIESKFFSYTNYEPILGRKEDRGEVKSLAYIAVKGLLYFASHDRTAIQLIEKATEWSTGLDNVKAIKMYELIYYLQKTKQAESKGIKTLYKYQYRLTKNEQKSNPNWIDFCSTMDRLYESYF